jgi:O-antigen/teichoic acid export membrane protein
MKIKLIFDKLKIENNRVLIKNISGSLLLKGVALIISFFTLPAYLSYFSSDVHLGIWFTLLSIISWVFTFDFGIGNGLRNELGKAYVKKEFSKCKQMVSTAYTALFILSFVMFLIGMTSIYFVNWNKLLNVDLLVINPNVLKITIMIIFLGIMMQFFLKLIQNIFDSLQKNIISSSLFIITTTFNLLYVSLFNTNNDQSNLLNLSIVYVFSSTTPLIVATLIAYLTKLKNIRPNIKFYKKEHLKSIASVGSSFFLIQIALLILINTDQFLITNIYGAQYVVSYQIYNKLFFLIVSIFSLIASPIWSAVTVAYAEKNYAWISNIYKKLNKLTIFSAIGLLLIYLFMQLIFNLWLGKGTFEMDYFTGFLFLLYSISLIRLYAVTSISNGIGKLKFQMIANSIGVILKIPFAYLSVYLFNGWVTIISINVIIFGMISIGQSITVKKHIKTLIKGGVILNESVNCITG